MVRHRHLCLISYIEHFTVYSCSIQEKTPRQRQSNSFKRQRSLQSPQMFTQTQSLALDTCTELKQNQDLLVPGFDFICSIWSLVSIDWKHPGFGNFQIDMGVLHMMTYMQVSIRFVLRFSSNMYMNKYRYTDMNSKEN